MNETLGFSYQGLDVLEIMRNIHVFVSRYLYNLNNQVGADLFLDPSFSCKTSIWLLEMLANITEGMRILQPILQNLSS
jgi:hypothetical protein